jgi:hypothetical protein
MPHPIAPVGERHSAAKPEFLETKEGRTMNRRRLLSVMLLVVPLAAAGCAEETTRILDPEPSNDPAATDI